MNFRIPIFLVYSLIFLNNCGNSTHEASIVTTQQDDEISTQQGDQSKKRKKGKRSEPTDTSVDPKAEISDDAKSDNIASNKKPKKRKSNKSSKSKNKTPPVDSELSEMDEEEKPKLVNNSVISMSFESGGVCAVFQGKKSKCWGSGLLRTGDPGTTPQQVDFINFGDNQSATTIFKNRTATCALLDDSSVKCFDFNDESGISVLSERDFGQPVVAISGKFSHQCALLNNGNIKCWGGQTPVLVNNSNAALGLGSALSDYIPISTTSANTPPPLRDGPNLDLVSTPSVNLGTGRTATYLAVVSRLTCATLDDNSTKCWGINVYGQTGSGTRTPATIGENDNELGDNLQPLDLGTGRTVVKIDGSFYTTCALLDDDTLKCWGIADPSYEVGAGLLPTGDQPNEMGDNLSPIDFGINRTVLDFSAGLRHICALLDTNIVKCWGQASEGQLGLESTELVRVTALKEDTTKVNLGTNRLATAIFAGANQTCATLDDESIKCWGNGIGGNPGEMGDNLAPLVLE